MKKYFSTTFLLIFLSVNSYSQLIKIETGFECSFQDKVIRLESETLAFSPIRTNVQLRAVMGNFKLITDNIIYMSKVKGKISFKPEQAVFKIRAEYSKRKIVIGITHECYHKIENYNKHKKGIFGGSNSIYFKYNII